MKTIVLILIVGLCAIALGLFLSFDCEDAIKTDVKSPDGKYAATLYERDCGATTDFSTIVSLRANGDDFDGEKGRIFVVEGQPQVNLVWQASNAIRIECSQCQSKDIFKREVKWQDVNISY